MLLCNKTAGEDNKTWKGRGQEKSEESTREEKEEEEEEKEKKEEEEEQLENYPPVCTVCRGR